MSVFAADAAAIFDGPLAVDADYTPDGGATVAVRVLLSQPDTTVEFGRAVLRADTTIAKVLVAAAPNLSPGDRFSIDGTDYVVQGEPGRDARCIVWTLELVPA